MSTEPGSIRTYYGEWSRDEIRRVVLELLEELGIVRKVNSDG